MKSRVISVTRRHIEFLFGTCKDSAPFFTRSGDMPNWFNREETVVTREPFWWPMVAPPLPVEEEGAWQLPPSDESKVGDD